MNRKTTIVNTGIYSDQCATYIQNTYKAKKYGIERFCEERSGARTIHIQINNAQSSVGAILRGVVGLNVCGTLSLTSTGNDLQVIVSGKRWPSFVRILVLLVGMFVFLWPLIVPAIIGFFMQKAFLDRLNKDTLEWVWTTRKNHVQVRKANTTHKVAQEASGGRAKIETTTRKTGQESSEEKEQIEFRCPHCGKQFPVSEDSEEYMIGCPGCGQQLDLTELVPL